MIVATTRIASWTVNQIAPKWSDMSWNGLASVCGFGPNARPAAPSSIWPKPSVAIMRLTRSRDSVSRMRRRCIMAPISAPTSIAASTATG